MDDGIWQYEKREDGTIVITNYTGTDTEVVVPETIDGAPVTAIGKGAFAGASTMDSLTINPLVTPKQGKTHQSVTTLALPKTLKYIDEFAFFGMYSLTGTDIPDGVEEIGGWAFEFCRSLTELTLPSTVKKIGTAAFASCPALRSMRLCGAQSLGDCAFRHCRSLERVEFQCDAELGTNVFTDCPNISAENAMQSLACSTDITRPFKGGIINFDWNTALRRDVFELAMKYDSFAEFDKAEVLKVIVISGRAEYLPIAESAGWTITSEQTDELLKISSYRGFFEMTAWLLDHKNRSFGFRGIGELDI